MPSRDAPPRTTSAVGMLSAPYAWVYGIVLGVFLILVWMVLAHLYFACCVWPAGEGLAAIGALVSREAAFAWPWLANLLGEWVYAALFKLSGIHGAVIAASNGAHMSAVDDAMVRGLIRPYAEEIGIMMRATRLFGIRLAIVCEIGAIGLLCAVPALVDGLVQRYVRRACAARESASLYHRAKHLQLAGVCLTVMLYPTIPANLDPRWLFLWPGAAATLVWLQAKFYKKYL